MTHLIVSPMLAKLARPDNPARAPAPLDGGSAARHTVRRSGV